MTAVIEPNNCVILNGVKYQRSEIHTEIDGKPFIISNLIPIFKSEEERNAVKEKIGNELFRIFRKYMS